MKLHLALVLLASSASPLAVPAGSYICRDHTAKPGVTPFPAMN